MSSDIGVLKKYLDEAAAFIRKSTQAKPRIAFVLGSGWDAFSEEIEILNTWNYSEIPHFVPPSVDGHKGKLVLGTVGGTLLYCLQGRVHFYEGHSHSQVTFPVRLMKHLGVERVCLTNASGGINVHMRAGDFMIIKDHINLTGSNPLIGPNPAFLGPRFPDMTTPYCPQMRAMVAESFKKNIVRFSEGVYAGVTGPTYETPAEIRYLRAVGGDAVGMSTVWETIAAVHAGMKVVGIACITNLAAGLSDETLSHQEVTQTARAVEKKMKVVLKEFTASLSAAGLV